MKLKALLLALLITTPALAELPTCKLYSRSTTAKVPAGPTIEDYYETKTDAGCPEGTFMTSTFCNIVGGTGKYESFPISSRSIRCEFTLNNESDYIRDSEDDPIQDEDGNPIYESSKFGRARAQVMCCK